MRSVRPVQDTPIRLGAYLPLSAHAADATGRELRTSRRCCCELAATGQPAAPPGRHALGSGGRTFSVPSHSCGRLHARYRRRRQGPIWVNLTGSRPPPAELGFSDLASGGSLGVPGILRVRRPRGTGGELDAAGRRVRTPPRRTRGVRRTTGAVMDLRHARRAAQVKWQQKLGDAAAGKVSAPRQEWRRGGIESSELWY